MSFYNYVNWIIRISRIRCQNREMRLDLTQAVVIIVTLSGLQSKIINQTTYLKRNLVRGIKVEGLFGCIGICLDINTNLLVAVLLTISKIKSINTSNLWTVHSTIHFTEWMRYRTNHLVFHYSTESQLIQSTASSTSAEAKKRSPIKDKTIPDNQAVVRAAN